MVKTLIVIAGPTAVGKTELSIKIANYFNTDIISADSRQCYQEMNIGTAKPNALELNTVKHYFIDSHSVHDEISAADFEQLGLRYAADIFSKNDTAILSGGTGLYIKALCEGIEIMPPVDPQIEQRAREEYKEKGIYWLQQEVESNDPLFFNQTEEIQNPHRLLRALIFKKSTGKSITEFRTGYKKNRDFNIIKIGLGLPRLELYERINNRVDKMIEEGLLEEAEGLLHLQHLKNLQTVGYSELFDFIKKKISFDKAVDLIKQNTRHYAKRQMTWFKKDKDFEWFDPKDFEKILGYILKSI